jgi:hypothetical protein
VLQYNGDGIVEVLAICFADIDDVLDLLALVEDVVRERDLQLLHLDLESSQTQVNVTT